ncbi:MAG: hypothetical protein OSJ27_03620 [Candidatus Gastranaerophilales bacterium]|nr:hypothetical protein [Candidatus Gastranaerophilales bacterium]
MTSLSLTPSNIFMILGFLLSLYTCVSNDVIQTLGTFLSSTKDRPVWQIWLFTSTVLVVTFVAGWVVNDGDMAFGLLERVPHPETFYWWHILPPLILLCLTKKGIPVATSFLIISIFSSNTIIGMMIAKSFTGYVAALAVSLVLYFFIARSVEKIFLYMKNKQVSKAWVIAKWFSTAVLWTAWLLQDGSKIFVYLPRKLDFWQMVICLIIFSGLLYIICYKRGGEIQNIIKLKTNTQDIRSATIIDIVYAGILIYFLNLNNITMSTTWVFLGVLAGREIALYNRLRFITEKKVYKYILKDFTKAVIGLVVSILVVIVINYFDEICTLVQNYLKL